jgi:transcriptional regulator with XRE-family HTH domain
MKTVDKEKVAKEFGAYIREVREKRGLYQYEIADQLGVARSYYTHIENGTRDIYFSSVVDICNILELDLNEFMKRLK